VFARITPLEKLRIVRALQDAGSVVAMTGDGSNDAPALRAADIGVALGGSGTMIARETADVVLAGDDLATMIVAVRQGRSIYANFRKAVRFLVGTNGAEVMLALTASGLGLSQPLNPAQLLWINLLTDVVIAVALGYEPPAADLMTQLPRGRDEPLLDAHDFRRLAAKSGLFTTSALMAHLYGVARHGPGGGGLAFSTLLVTQLMDGLSSRSETRPVWGLAANPALRRSVLGLLAAQAAVTLFPATRGLLGIAALDGLDLAVIATGSLAPFLAVELLKPGAGEQSAKPPIGKPSRQRMIETAQFDGPV
jgi:Ca2+-transporting ATPase